MSRLLNIITDSFVLDYITFNKITEHYYVQYERFRIKINFCKLIKICGYNQKIFEDLDGNIKFLDVYRKKKQSNF